MTDVPADLAPYKTTRVFHTETVPQALTRLHRTAAGVWGRIEVFSGALDPIRFDDDGQETVRDAVPVGDTAIVAPREPHAVALRSGTAFSVTFLRSDAAMTQQGGL